MGLCLILLYISYEYDSVVIKVVAFGIMFIVNAAVINPGISYKTGEDITIVSDTYTQITTTYDDYGTHWIGFLLAVVGFFGSSYSIFEYNNAKRREAGDD